jgi:adenylate cyclase
MRKLINSLQTKLTFSFIVLIMVIYGLSSYYTINETKNTLKESAKEELAAVASSVAALIDGDAVVKLKPGDEKTTGYAGLSSRLNTVERLNSEIKFVYIYSPVDSKTVKFIVSPSFDGTTAGSPAKIGFIYRYVTPEMLVGFKQSAVEDDITAGKNGEFISGYAPIRNSKGAVVAAVGVDMPASIMIKKEKFISSIMFFVMSIAVIFAGIIVLLFSETIIRDINKLNRIAEDVSLGKIDNDVDVKRSDEIGDLAQSFQRMITSLRIMRMYPDDKKEDK